MVELCRGGQSRRKFLTGVATGALTAGSLSIGSQAFAFVPPEVVPVTVPTATLQAFDLADVTLGEGPFLHAQRKTEAYLLALQPDRMLHNFRVNAGLAPKAPVYGGWESDPLWADINCHGHTLGHYLSACALAYRSTGDRRFKARIDISRADWRRARRRRGPGWSVRSRTGRRWWRRICAAIRLPACRGTRCTRCMRACAMRRCWRTATRRARCCCGWPTGRWSRAVR